MNIEEFSYEFNSNGVENLISKLNQMEYETQQLDKAVSHFGSTFGKVFDYLLKSAVPPAFIKLIGDQAMAFSKQAAYLDKLSQTSGISAKNIQQLGYALYKFGGDTDVATRSLVSLKEKIDQLKELKKKGREGFSDLFTIRRKYGLSLNGAEDPMTLLKQIAATMDKLSKDKQIKFAKALGLDNATFLMVKKGIKSVEEELYKAQKYTLFDEKDIQTSVKFEDTIKEIGADIELVSKSFSFGALPQLQKFSDKIRSVTNYLSEHPEVVKGLGLVTFSAGATGALRLLEAIPAKFLAGTAAVSVFGTAVGMANEELKRIEETGSKEGTLLGDLDNSGLKGTSKAIEQIWRMLSKFGEFKFIEGLKELDNIFENIVTADTDNTDPLSSFAENVIETKEEVTQAIEELKDTIQESGIEEESQKWFEQGIETVKGIQKYSNELYGTLKTAYSNMDENNFSAGSIKTEIINVYKKIKADISDVFSSIKNNTPTLISDAKKKGTGIYSDIKNNISDIYTEIKNKSSPYVSAIKDIALYIYQDIKSGFTSLFDYIKQETPGYVETIKNKSVDLYNQIKTDIKSLHQQVEDNSSTYLESSKITLKNLYKSIKDSISSWYDELTRSSTEEDDNQDNLNKVKEIKSKSVNGIKAFFEQALEIVTDAFKSLPDWIQNALSTGLKTFLVTWLMTGFDTKKAGIAGSLMGIRSALNTKIDQGDKNAEIYKDILNDSLWAYGKGYTYSLGDKDVANTYALSAVADSLVQNSDRFKDKNFATQLLADNKDLVNSFTSFSRTSSIMQSYGASENFANIMAFIRAGTKYKFSDNTDSDVLHKIENWLSELWNGKKELDDLNTNIKSLNISMTKLAEGVGMNPNSDIRTLDDIVKYGTPNITNDNVSNSNFIVNNTMTVNGGDPKMIEKSVANATTASLQKYNNMRNSADFITVGTK